MDTTLFLVLKYIWISSLVILIAAVLLRVYKHFKRKYFPDPAHYCDVYKEEGCAHVDGFLCAMDTCESLKTRRDLKRVLETVKFVNKQHSDKEVK